MNPLIRTASASATVLLLLSAVGCSKQELILDCRADDDEVQPIRIKVTGESVSYLDKAGVWESYRFDRPEQGIRADYRVTPEKILIQSQHEAGDNLVQVFHEIDRRTGEYTTGFDLGKVGSEPNTFSQGFRAKGRCTSLEGSKF